MKLMIIWGSSRTGRKGGIVTDWVKNEVVKESWFEIDFVDLKERNLPFFDEPKSPFMMQGLDEYSHPEGKAWAERVQIANAVILITPEYNHAPPGVLKNALDWVGKPWLDKPVGLISYGGAVGGARAVEKLRSITIELGLVNVATPLHFPYFEEAFDAQGQPKRLDYYQANFKKMLNEIVRLKAAFSRT